MSQRKHEHSERVLHQPVIESKHFIGNFELLLTKDCSPEMAAQIAQRIQNSGNDWFTNCKNTETPSSRREVCIVQMEPTGTIVVKQKAIKHTSEPHLKVPYFTQSIVHELRSSYLLHDVLPKIKLPKSVPYNGVNYALSYEVQTPLAAILHLRQPSERATIFRYIPGDSIRDEVRDNGGWNATSEEKRKLFGQLHGVLNILSNQLLEFGVEPWDLGVHQLIYTIDTKNKSIHLGILDTEEYNFSTRFGSHWPKSFSSIGLPVVLPFL